MGYSDHKYTNSPLLISAECRLMGREGKGGAGRMVLLNIVVDLCRDLFVVVLCFCRPLILWIQWP